ncbi:MAG: hypothetical protein ACOC2N_01900 [Spirochaetota bacterium]
MNRRTLQSIAKIGLLLVVIGFLMPISCGKNGFELANTFLDISGEGSSVYLAGILTYFIFIFSLAGVASFWLKPSLVRDWAVLVLSFGSALGCYLLLKGSVPMVGDPQAGVYMMALGWLITAVSLVWAGRIPEEGGSPY